MTALSVNVVSESAFTIGGHGVHSAFLEDVALLRVLDGVEVSVNRPRRADVQHVHTVGPYASMLMRAGRRSVITAHLTPASLVGSLRGDRLWHRAFLRRVRDHYNRADVVLAVSPGDVPAIRDLGVSGPVQVVPNAINVAAVRVADRAIARRRLAISPDAFVVVATGQVQPRKAVDTFVACARAIPNALFHWVGGMIFGPLGAERPEMRRLISGAPGNLRFTGTMPRHRVFEHLAAADLFFLPSRYESCPLAVIEAAAAGLPIIMRDIPGCRLLFGNGCSYGDEGTFVDLLRTCVDDPAVRADLARAASEMAQGFDSAAKAARLIRIYRSLL